jgi:hypothetical protein
MDFYSKYDSIYFQNIQESKEVQDHLHLTSISLSNELVKVRKMCPNVAKITFPEDTYSEKYFSPDLVRSICLNSCIISIEFNSYQNENIFKTS